MQRLRIAIGLHDGTLSGVNTYVEHVAAAASTGGGEVAVLVTREEDAADIGTRLEGFDVRVIVIDAPRPGRRRDQLERLSPGLVARRLNTAFVSTAARLGHFDVVHLNHPFLAIAGHAMADRVFVAAWFYPYAAVPRALAVWEHSGRRFPRSAALALKGVMHHRNDVRGYRAADGVVAPTRSLADQLAHAGIPAVQAFPPCRAPASGESSDAAGAPADCLQLLVCSGDLSHPRKNVGLAVDAVGLLASGGRRVRLELVGSHPNRLARQLDRLPKSVEVVLHGRLPASGVHARMAMADALLFPSLFEEWGYVAVESMQRGTPVVTLPVYPFSDMFEEPMGYRSTATDVHSYARAIVRATEQDVDRSEVARLAERRFDIDLAGRRLLEIWTAR
jgi:glycosyltransferase involved in cell wall biosynthesis